jgi:hypothetical protein
MKLRLAIIFAFMFTFFSLISPVAASELDDYKRDVDNYRSAYVQFQIKQKSYEQSSTFAAEEDLVKAAQTMLINRADVWITYWKLHSFLTKSLTRLPESDKAEYVEKFKTEIDWLESHKSRVQSQKTRSSLMEIATLLNQKAEQYNTLAFEANTTESTELMRQAVVRLQNFNSELTQRVSSQQLTAAQKEVKLRGLQVNRERLDTAWQSLAEFQTDTMDMAGSASQTSFLKIAEQGTPIHAQLSQLNQVLHELSEGVEW